MEPTNPTESELNKEMYKREEILESSKKIIEKFTEEVANSANLSKHLNITDNHLQIIKSLGVITCQREIFAIESILPKTVEDQIIYLSDPESVDEYKKQQVKLQKLSEHCIKFKNSMEKTQMFKDDKTDSFDEIDTTRLLVSNFNYFDNEIYNKKLELMWDEQANTKYYLESDSYLLTSKFIDLFVVYCISFLIYIPFSIAYIFGKLFRRGKSEERQSEELKPIREVIKVNLIWLPLFLTLFMLALPGALVIATQTYCLITLSGENSNDSSDDNNFEPLLRILFILFYVFLSMKEVSASTKTLGYFFRTMSDGLKEKKEDTTTQDSSSKQLKSYKIIIIYVLNSIRLLPQIIQIFFCFWFCYINLILISQITSTVDLIQNFAALTILLELDNLIMNFLQLSGFKRIYQLAFDFLEIIWKYSSKEDKTKTSDERGSWFNKKNYTDEEKAIKKQESIRKSTMKENLNAKEYLKEEIEKMELLKKKLDKIIEKKDDVFDNLVKFNLENLMITIPEFLMNYFECRSRDITGLLSDERFKIKKKYRLEQDEVRILDIFGFFIIFVGLIILTLIYIS